MTGKSPKAGPEAPVAITKGTMDKLLDLKNPSDSIALLMFYTHAATRQGTNQPYATTSFCSKGLNWGERKTRAAKRILVDKGLVEDVRGVEKETGKTQKWFIRLPYLTKKTTLADLDRVDCKNHPCSLPQGGRTTRVDFDRQLLKVTEQLLKVTEENCLKKLTPPKPPKGGKGVSDEVVDSIYEAYPRKVRRDAALKSIRKRLKEGVDPDYLLERTKAYASAVQGKDRQFIPHPATWFNGGGYGDNPEEWNPEAAKPPKNWQKYLHAACLSLGKDSRLYDGEDWATLPDCIQKEIRELAGEGGTPDTPPGPDRFDTNPPHFEAARDIVVERYPTAKSYKQWKSETRYYKFDGTFIKPEIDAEIERLATGKEKED